MTSADAQHANARLMRDACTGCGRDRHPGRTCRGETAEQVTARLVRMGARRFSLPPIRR